MKFPVFVRPLSAIFKFVVIGGGLVCLLLLLVFTQHSLANAKSAQPDAPGSISGSVKDDSSASLAGIEVTAFQQLASGIWLPVRQTQTNATGAYTLGLLGAGIYRLAFTDPDGHWAQIYYPHASMVALADDVPVAGTNVANINVTLTPGGRISGAITILRTSGFPDPDKTVKPYLSIWAEQKVDGQWFPLRMATLPAGQSAYIFTGLPEDVYRICTGGTYAVPFSDPYHECYDNVYAVEDATDIQVTAGESVTNVNFVLGDGADLARVTGKVTATNGAPLAQIVVSALISQSSSFGDGPNWEMRQLTQTDATGVYTLENLLPGLYIVQFSDYTNGYLSNYYGNVSSSDKARTVQVVHHAVISDVNATLITASHITGLAMLVDGVPPTDGAVIAQQQVGLDWQLAASSLINPRTGQYHLDGLTAGVYKLMAYGSLDGPYSFMGYYGGNTWETAVPVTVSTAITKIGINITLTSTNGLPLYQDKIVGHVTTNGAPLANMKVSLYQANCCPNGLPPFLPGSPSTATTPSKADQVAAPNAPAATADIKPLVYVTTDANGQFVIDGLTDGRYYLGVSDPAGAYATVYYPDQVLLHYAQGLTLVGNRLTLQNGIPISTVDVALVRGGGITGHVHLRDGTPADNLTVEVFAPVLQGSWELMATENKTDAVGNFTIKGLPAGVYRLCFVDPLSRYTTECYGAANNGDPASGVNITVQPNLISKIDHTLGPKLKAFLPLIQQKQPVSLYFNSATVSKCERQPAGNWFEGTTYVNGQPQNGFKVVFSYAPDGPPVTPPAISGPHEGYPGWKIGYYSHIIHAQSPQAGDWYVWIVDDVDKRISEIAHWRSTGPGDGCNQAEVDFDSR